MRFGRKKGQSGSSAATLVAVIGLLIVLYIVFLPPDIRKDLLAGNSTENLSSGDIITTILSESPGRLEQISNLEVEHNLPSLNLFALSGAKVLKKASSLYVKNGVFDKKSEKMTFDITDFEHTDNVLLSFTVDSGKGRLVVTLNGQEIYNNVITSRNVAPIELPKDMLQQSNTLEFSVSDVGLAFWSTNEYSLENVQVTADVTDVSAQQSKNVFVLSTTEKFNLDRARLRFFADCNQGEIGTLHILVNNHEVFAAVPDCGMLRPVEFSPAYLESGENNVVFKTDSGRYLIDQISVITDLKEITFPSYYFELSNSQLADITDGNDDINMTLRFVDSQELKSGKIYINGKTISLNTHDSTYVRNLNNFVEQGQNGIKVEPDQTVLDIIELRVDLLKK
jgi:hypothetical protein